MFAIRVLCLVVIKLSTARFFFCYLLAACSTRHTLGFMELMTALAALSTEGLSVLRAVNKLIDATSAEQLAKDSGFPRSRIRHYVWVWNFYKDDEVQAAAETAQLSFGVIEILATAVNKCPKNRDKKADLIALCQLVQGLDADSARAVAYDQVRAWQEDDKPDKADYAHMHKEVEPDGKRRFVARLRDDRASEINRVLHNMAKSIMKASDNTKAYSVAYADALCQKILNSTPHPAANQTPLFAPMFVIPTDCQYFADGRIATTAGGLVDLADLVNEPLKDTGYAAVMAKDETGVPQVVQLVPVHYKNDVENQRFAPPEIRLIATIETLKCSRPGCDRPAANCEMHHIDAWALGSKTTSANIAALCSTDNGLNDDDPSKPPKHGRIERDPITGRPGLRREPGAELEFNQHPLTKKGTRVLGEQFYGLRQRE